MAAENVLPDFYDKRPSLDHHVVDMASAEAITFGREAEARLKVAALYQRYSRLVFVIAFRTTGDRCIAEDVVQDVFFRLWKQPSRFNPELGNVAAWLTVAARHRAIDYLRKRCKDAALSEYGELTRGFKDVENADTVAQVMRVMLALPARQRNALKLAFCSGLAHAEISRRLGEPLGTVKSLIREGLGQLRATFLRNK